MSHLYSISFQIEDSEDFSERYEGLLVAIGERSYDLWVETPYYAMAESELTLEQMNEQLKTFIDPSRDILLIVELLDAQYKIEGNYQEKPA